MGAGNVAAAYARWSWLPDSPFRLLAYMALVSLDDDDPPRYWGGREPLALAIGYADLPKAPATQQGPPSAQAVVDERARERAFRSVRRAIDKLESAGVVTRAAAAANGRRSEYELHLLANRSEGFSPMVRRLPAEKQGRARTTADLPDETSESVDGSQEVTGCPPGTRSSGDLLRGTPDDLQADTSRPPATRTPDDPLTRTPDDLPGGHPASAMGDTGCPALEEDEEEGGTQEENDQDPLESHQRAGASDDPAPVAPADPRRPDVRAAAAASGDIPAAALETVVDLALADRSTHSPTGRMRVDASWRARLVRQALAGHASGKSAVEDRTSKHAQRCTEALERLHAAGDDGDRALEVARAALGRSTTRPLEHDLHLLRAACAELDEIALGASA